MPKSDERRRRETKGTAIVFLVIAAASYWSGSDGWALAFGAGAVLTALSVRWGRY